MRSKFSMQTKLVLSLIVSQLFLALPSLASGPSGTYKNDDSHTVLLWRLNHAGLSDYVVRMNDVDLTLEFNERNPARSKVVAIIDPRSVDTGFRGSKDFDVEIGDSSAMFNSFVFPEIRFESKRIKMISDTQAQVTGALSFVGVSQDITLDVELTGSMAKHFFAGEPAMGFRATTEFKRSDFGIDILLNQGVGDLVSVEVIAEFIREK